MSNTRTPRQGDRVRVTLGKNVNEGVVTYATNFGIDVQVDGDRDFSQTFPLSPWIFEIITPPIPDVDKSACLDSDGDAWQFRCWDDSTPLWRSASTDERFHTSSALDNEHGPLVELAVKQP